MQVGVQEINLYSVEIPKVGFEAVMILVACLNLSLRVFVIAL